MARPTTKTALIKAANEQFEKMWQLIDSLPEAKQNAPFQFQLTDKQTEAHWRRDKNLRDVLIHLYEWHQLLINWITANQKGENKPFLPEPYNWKTYGEMNVKFFEKHQSTSYAAAKEMLKESHKEVLHLIEGFSNEELFENKHFKWTGTSSLGSYCVSATASHYDWAMKKVKAHMKA
jgi:Uncharacterized conserved protein